MRRSGIRLPKAAPQVRTSVEALALIPQAGLVASFVASMRHDRPARGLLRPLRPRPSARHRRPAAERLGARQGVRGRRPAHRQEAVAARDRPGARDAQGDRARGRKGLTRLLNQYPATALWAGLHPRLQDQNLHRTRGESIRAPTHRPADPHGTSRGRWPTTGRHEFRSCSAYRVLCCGVNTGRVRLQERTRGRTTRRGAVLRPRLHS